MRKVPLLFHEKLFEKSFPRIGPQLPTRGRFVFLDSKEQNTLHHAKIKMTDKSLSFYIFCVVRLDKGLDVGEQLHVGGGK